MLFLINDQNKNDIDVLIELMWGSISSKKKTKTVEVCFFLVRINFISKKLWVIIAWFFFCSNSSKLKSEHEIDFGWNLFLSGGGRPTLKLIQTFLWLFRESFWHGQ